MASITIRNLDEAVKKDLRKQAAEHGRSLEAEARAILGDGVKKKRPAKEETGADLFRRIQERFKPFGGIELNLPKRGAVRRSRIPDFTRDDLGWPEKV
jgi:plasmid stability protein